MADSTGTPFSDEAFERTLLDAGRSESVPLAGEQAWQQFAGSLSALSGIAAAPSLRTSAPARPLLARALHSVALKYLLIGAALGSLTTWIWLDARQASRSVLARSVPAQRAPTAAISSPWFVAGPPSGSAPANRNDERSSSAPRPGTPAQPVTIPVRSRAARTQTAATLARAAREHTVRRDLDSPEPNQRVPGGSPKSGLAASPAGAASTLSAEVAALDAARAAARRGANDEALRCIERYRDEFPAGLLGADADAVAIEALSAAGRYAEAARLAARFLVSRPNDPHTAAIRQILGK